jgi:hypothetical protein
MPRYYICCGWISPTQACQAQFGLPGGTPGTRAERDLARAAGWFVWGDDDRRGLVLCPAHKDQPAGAAAEAGGGARKDASTGGAAFPPAGASENR